MWAPPSKGTCFKTIFLVGEKCGVAWATQEVSKIADETGPNFHFFLPMGPTDSCATIKARVDEG